MAPLNKLLTIAELRASYASGEASVVDVIEEVYRRIEDDAADPAVWIYLVPKETAVARARELELNAGKHLPLFGIPFAVKDNIDVAEIPTTAGCPAYAYVPVASATVVQRLIEAGAILIGKTNLDQFATGLVGTRSPFGAPRCVFNRDYVSGGSSSGSAVAVASGLVCFSLGTDTAGSGRVPAAFNDIVGLKPTRGIASTSGVVPACRSLDCVSVFSHTCTDALAVLDVIEGYDATDAFSRHASRSAGLTNESESIAQARSSAFRFAVPRADQMRFFGDSEAERLFALAIDRVESLGGQRTEFDYDPFAEAAALLYGPWVAERYAAIGEFLDENPASVHLVVRSIISAARGIDAVEVFRGYERLAAIRRQTEAVWDSADFLVLPTTGTIYKHDEVIAEPFALNANLGFYTNFMNLLDLCGVAVPAGFRQNRTPFGITLVGQAWEDRNVAALGERYLEAYRREVSRPSLDDIMDNKTVHLAVVGAHLSGQPLNHQLTSRNARLVRACKSAPSYRLYALAGTTPPKPGLVHTGANAAEAHAIELEVWELSLEAFGSFVAEVPPPLAIGTVELEDGTTVKGFVCEPRALDGATEISHFGGWRAYRSSEAAS